MKEEEAMWRGPRQKANWSQVAALPSNDCLAASASADSRLRQTVRLTLPSTGFLKLSRERAYSRQPYSFPRKCSLAWVALVMANCHHPTKILLLLSLFSNICFYSVSCLTHIEFCLYRQVIYLESPMRSDIVLVSWWFIDDHVQPYLGPQTVGWRVSGG